MIMVGQERALAQPLRSTLRERRMIATLGGLLVLACVAAAIVYATRGGGASAGMRCVTASAASYTGGVTIKQCGAQAAAWCRQAYAASAGDVLARAVRAACRETNHQ